MELQLYIDTEFLPYEIGVQGNYVHINSTNYPFEGKFLDKLNELGFKITSITNLKETGQTIICIWILR